MAVEPTMADLAKKLDEVLGFFHRLEAAFSPPAREPTAAELDGLRKEVEEAMDDMPSQDDLLMWSTPGPLPSELAEAQATVPAEDE